MKSKIDKFIPLKKNRPLISICIPSYNRPKELLRLLKSIDCEQQDAEIVICEDKSPKRSEIKKIVEEFKDTSPYTIRFYLNDENLGYDRNIRELVVRANGNFIVFMGDDDAFVPKALDKLIQFLHNNKDIGYVLKSHKMIHLDGAVEPFRYFEETKFFESGIESYVELFRKSVFISGFTINREYAKMYLIDNFDGTLLMQLYLLAEVTLKYKSAYFDVPLTIGYAGGIPLFGNSDAEKELYTPGIITIENSLNFLKGFFKITNYIDNKYDISSTDLVRSDMSKYFYPSLAIQRNGGIFRFIRYVIKLRKLGFRGGYFNLYSLALIVFGKSNCDFIIRNIKKIIGRTPRL